MRKHSLKILFVLVLFLSGCSQLESLDKSIKEENAKYNAPAFREYLRDREKFGPELAEYRAAQNHSDNVKSWYK